MQITDHVHALRIDFEIKPRPGITVKRFVYGYTILGDRVHLVDTGVASSIPMFYDYLKHAGRIPQDIQTVILTHAHPDHIGGLKPIHDQSRCRVLAHAEEKAWIETPARQAAQRPVPGFDRLVSGPAPVDQVVGDGDEIELEPDLTLQVFHTPGHSPGSISLLLPEEKVLFTGDAVAFAWGIPVYDDVRASIASIQKLQSVAGVDVLLSSWDEPRRGAAVAKVFSDSLDYLQAIHTSVRTHVKDPTSVDPMALCRAVFTDLHLPAVAVNPLCARSLLAHVPLLDQPVIC